MYDESVNCQLSIVNYTEAILNILTQDIKYLQGVGPNRATLLANDLNIKTVGDLLAYYPYKYVARSRIYKIN